MRLEQVPLTGKRKHMRVRANSTVYTGLKTTGARLGEVSALAVSERVRERPAFGGMSGPCRANV